MARCRTVPDPYIRWLIRQDMPAVLDIDRFSFSHEWQEADFLEELRKRNVIGMVVDEGKAIQGFMIYALEKTRIQLLRLAVHPDVRWIGYGSAMVRKLVDKVSSHRRESVEIDVRESNIVAQMFFKDCGFRAVRVIRDGFDEEDAYRMEWRIGT